MRCTSCQRLTENRPGFYRLINDWVSNPNAPEFDYIFVYDVSRWGRFQDPNQSAYFEYLCTKHGKQVIYIDRGFPKKEDELATHLLTSVDRYMAAQYSKVLSGKVFDGSMRVSQDGYSAGGMACYGMSRLLLNEAKEPIGILKRGEHKMISNQRVTFIPSDDHETETVRDIFRMFTGKLYLPEEIAAALNEEGKVSATGKQWDKEKVTKILRNEVYMGTRVYNKRWGRLKQPSKKNPRSQWVVTKNAFTSVVDITEFKRAQEQLYWLTSSQWQLGARSIRRVRSLIEMQLERLLSLQEEYDQDTRWSLKQHFPLVFSTSYKKNGAGHWCFLITEEAKRFNHVIGVGVNTEQGDTIDRVFYLPTSKFTAGKYYLVGGAKSGSDNYTIEPEILEERVLTLLKEVKVKAGL